MQGNDWQLVRYVGHTLQGGYKGSFVLSRTADLSPASLAEVPPRPINFLINRILIN